LKHGLNTLLINGFKGEVMEDYIKHEQEKAKTKEQISFDEAEQDVVYLVAQLRNDIVRIAQSKGLDSLELIDIAKELL